MPLILRVPASGRVGRLQGRDGAETCICRVPPDGHQPLEYWQQEVVHQSGYT